MRDSGVVRARLLLPAVFGAAALLGAPRAAEPCTPFPPWVGARVSFPEDGAIDVPTNARVLVEYDWHHWDDVGNLLELRQQGGATVAVEVTQSRGHGLYEILTPTAPL